MSSVRMCDKCGTVFSELEDGWQTFTARTIKRQKDGSQKSIDAAMDTCPSCAIMPVQQFQAELEAAKEGDELQARIAKLERENGMDADTGLFTKPAAATKAAKA